MNKMKINTSIVCKKNTNKMKSIWNEVHRHFEKSLLSIVLFT
jgi:hypothetical protein